MAATNRLPASHLSGNAANVGKKTSLISIETLEKERASTSSLGHCHSALMTYGHEVRGDDADPTTTLQSGTPHNTTTTTSINERNDSDSESDEETLATPPWLSDRELVELVQALIENKATDILVNPYTAQRRWEKRR